MSVQRHVLNGLLRANKWYLARQEFPRICTFSRQYMDQPARDQRPPAFVQTRQEQLDGVMVEWVSVPETPRDGPVVLYFHGGGFFFGGPHTHRDLGWRLARASGARVLLVDYRLAPEHQYPSAHDDALTVYQRLLADGVNPNQLALAGDSAGGNLVLSTLQRARDAGMPLPAAAIAYSAWLDLSHSGSAVTRNARRDPMIPVSQLEGAARAYLPEGALNDPGVSPLFGDVQGLPPFELYVGDSEILFSDSERLAERLRAAGVPVRLHIGRGLPHAWPVMARFLPDGRVSIQQSGEFLRERFR